MHIENFVFARIHLPLTLQSGRFPNVLWMFCATLRPILLPMQVRLTSISIPTFHFLAELQRRSVLLLKCDVDVSALVQQDGRHAICDIYRSGGRMSAGLSTAGHDTPAASAFHICPFSAIHVGRVSWCHLRFVCFVIFFLLSV